MPDPAAAAPAVLAQSPAVALFLERATALHTAGPGVNDEQIRTIAEICARLDGMPLAIELAAARTRVLPLPALLERLRDPLQLLAGGPRDLPQRQRTLRATLDWSFNLLDAEQQKLFRRMSVFVGGATAESIEAVCNAKEDLDLDVLDAIEALVDNSLVRRTGADLTEPRFVMFETMREYGLAKLEDAGEEEYTRKAHAAYFVVLAEEGEHELSGSQRPIWFARFEAELGNLRAALDWLAATGEALWGLRLATALALFWYDQGLAAEGRERLEKLLVLPAAQPRNRLRAWALAWAADLQRKLHSESKRIQQHDESLEIYEEIGDIRGCLRVINSRAVTLRELKEYDQARLGFERAVSVARELGEPGLLAGSLSNLADMVKIQGDYEMARLLHIESMHLFQQAGDGVNVAWSLNHQADLAREQDNLEQARTLYEQALARFRALQHRPGIAACFYDLGSVAAAEGDYTTAQRLYQESLTLYWDLGSYKMDLPRLLEALAQCAAARQASERALVLAASAAALRQTLDVFIREASVRARLEQSLDDARSRVDRAAATASWMRGWNMPLEEAVRMALGLDSATQS
jgi:tetratricopeptide (TPR) repeat protein